MKTELSEYDFFLSEESVNPKIKILDAKKFNTFKLLVDKANVLEYMEIDRK